MEVAKYDYWKAVEKDVRYFVDDALDLHEWRGKGTELADYMIETLDDDIDVTGGSIGYENSAEKAEENICHNLDLLMVAIASFGEDTEEILSEGAKTCDSIIRRYVLRTSAYEIAEELCERFAFEEAA